MISDIQKIWSVPLDMEKMLRKRTHAARRTDIEKKIIVGKYWDEIGKVAQKQKDKNE